jgi:hypothetical protein
MRLNLTICALITLGWVSCTPINTNPNNSYATSQDTGAINTLPVAVRENLGSYSNNYFLGYTIGYYVVTVYEAASPDTVPYGVIDSTNFRHNVVDYLAENVYHNAFAGQGDSSFLAWWNIQIQETFISQGDSIEPVPSMTFYYQLDTLYLH